MKIDVRLLRAYAPLAVLLVTIGAGWTVFVRPLSADQSRAAGRLAGLRQREMGLRLDISRPSPRGVDDDPAAAFERQVAHGNASPAVVEHLARLASAAHARNLLIETVEAGPATVNTPASVPTEAGRYAALRDPRFALFDVPVSHVPIRVAFDTDFASLGRFLWAFRTLPTTVEIRALSVAPPPPDPGDETSFARGDVLRAALTLHAYSRLAPEVVPASNTVTR